MTLPVWAGRVIQGKKEEKGVSQLIEIASRLYKYHGSGDAGQSPCVMVRITILPLA